MPRKKTKEATNVRINGDLKQAVDTEREKDGTTFADAVEDGLRRWLRSRRRKEREPA